MEAVSFGALISSVLNCSVSDNLIGAHFLRSLKYLHF